MRSPMADGGLRIVGEKPIWEGELFFFLPDSEGAGVGETFGSFVKADIRTSPFLCWMSSRSALIALHTIVEEGKDGEDGCHAPGLGDGWIVGCPKSPKWEREGEARSEDESVSSSGSQGGNVSNEALHVIGLYGPGDKISLSSCRIGSWQRWLCHMALDMLCQEMQEAW